MIAVTVFLSFESNCNQHTEKYFQSLIKSNRNQIVFTMHRLIWKQTDTVRLLFQINRKMVNTIWFRFDLIGFRKYFSVCRNFLLRGRPVAQFCGRNLLTVHSFTKYDKKYVHNDRRYMHSSICIVHFLSYFLKWSLLVYLAFCLVVFSRQGVLVPTLIQSNVSNTLK